MMYRCYNELHERYADYGGRGITVCPEWHDLDSFVDDMGPCPKGYTLERIDNDKSYNKENCKWATYTEQANNMRKTITACLNGVTKKCSVWVAELSEVTGLKKSTIRRRITEGWTYDEIISIPVKGYRSNKHKSVRPAKGSPEYAKDVVCVSRGSPRYGENLIGSPPFGRLTVIAYAGRNKHGQSIWECKCSCGNTTKVATATLKSGHTRSCGCLKLKQSKGD